MGDELKALLEAVNKLQPVLADPSHSSELKLLREQVERIASLAGTGPVSNARTTGDYIEGGPSLAGAHSVSNLRPKGEIVGSAGAEGPQPSTYARPVAENVDGETSSAGAHPAFNRRPMKVFIEHMGAQQASRARASGEHVEQLTSLAGPQSMAHARATGEYVERLASLAGSQPPVTNVRATWDHVERIASLGPPPTSNAHTAWDHVDRIAFPAGAQPATNTRTMGITNASDKGITHASDRNFDARPRPKTQENDEECTEYGPGQSLSIGRIYKTGKWTPAETLALVHCKRGHFLKYGATSHRKNMVTSAAERWSELEDEMLRRNVLRSKQQCQEKWEQLACDFKKVYDYQQKRVPLGEPSYFQLSPVERKEHKVKFPKAALDEGVFNAMCEWYPRNSQALDPGDLPNDSPFDVAATPRGNLAPDAPTLEDNRPTLEDGTGDSSSPNSTKRRRKASEGAISAIENNRKESVNVATLSVGQDREDARHRAALEMDAKRHRENLEFEARKHQDKLIIEKERLQRSAALGQGYIAALLSIADGLKGIGEALNKS